MIDKEKCTNHIRDLELKQVMIKNLSKVESVLSSHVAKTTDFMNPYELRNFVSILKGIDGLSFRICEYGKQAERRQIQIYPDYIREEDLENPFTVFRLRVTSKASPTHRDYLGALLSIGIKREKTGDIYVQEGGAYLVTDEQIADYVQMNLESVSRERVLIERIETGDLQVSAQRCSEKVIYLSSVRADAVVAEVFHLSRSKAQALIAAGRLKVDYEPISSNAKEIKEHSLISVKGYGRAYFDKILMETKKGRLRAAVRLLE